MLGTNDAKPWNWNQTNFVQDYTDMAQSFLDISPQPILYLMIPPPVNIEDNIFSINQKVVNEIYPEIIPQIAESLKLPKQNVINIFQTLGGKELSGSNKFFCNSYCCDGVHPTDPGYFVMAKKIFKTLFENSIISGESTDK